jgi:NAD(P)-dependent dehydrogenase (short-subunit alcohol dehydrogenase family)
VDKGAGTATVLLLNRPSDRTTKVEADLRKSIPEGSKTNIESIPCDLQDFESVKQAASLIKSKYEAIDVLCNNNAGVMALEDVATKDGYDVQMQTNHLSHFLLTKELYPLLKKARDLRGEARVVHHSSAACKQTDTPLEAKYLEKNGGNLGGNGSSMCLGGARWQCYHQTKLANAVMTLALQDRFGDSGIKVTAAALGLAATNLQVMTNQQGGMGWGMWIMWFAQSAEDGTMPLAAACFDQSTNNGDFWEPEGSGNMKGPDRLSRSNMTS